MTTKTATIKTGDITDQGFTVLKVRTVSKNIADDYLRIVLCFKETQWGNKYVTWIYNEYGGMHNGNYFDGYLEKMGFGLTDDEALKQAIKDYYTRS